MKSSTLKHIKQKLELLEMKEKFQEEILGLRKKWKIPQGGFRNDEDNEKWWRKIEMDSDKRIYSTDYSEAMDVAKARRKKAIKNGNRGLQ